MGKKTGIWLRHSLAQLSERACKSKEGPFSPKERGFFQTEIYRALICKFSRLGHAMIKSRGENCNGQAALCRASRVVSRPAVSNSGQEDFTGALDSITFLRSQE